MNKTLIEWVRNPDGSQGYSWNPITGCLNSCPYCYARKLANGRLRRVYRANGLVLAGLWDDPFSPRYWPDRLDEPYPATHVTRGRTTMIYQSHKRQGIFVCDMGELFGPWLPESCTRQVLDVIRDCPQHRFYLLTKQPQELAKWSPFPPNAWVGVSVWDYWSYVDACNYLAEVEATVKYLSLEPLLSWDKQASYFFNAADIDWLIIGAQTKPLVLPDKGWVDEIIAAADRAGVKVFLKNSLKPLYGPNLRQEVPNGL